jgi:lactoylglutathione lyase
MSIEHIAIWTIDLEKIKSFYCRFFGTTCNQKYVNPNTGFESYFLTFERGARLEIMYSPSVVDIPKDILLQTKGLVHFAVSVGSIEKVNELTQTLANEGFIILGKPRTTGDGYYESVVLDPENNSIEITV